MSKKLEELRGLKKVMLNNLTFFLCLVCNWASVQLEVRPLYYLV